MIYQRMGEDFVPSDPSAIDPESPILILGDTEQQVETDVAKTRKTRWGWLVAAAAAAAGIYFSTRG